MTIQFSVIVWIGFDDDLDDDNDDDDEDNEDGRRED